MITNKEEEKKKKKTKKKGSRIQTKEMARRNML
jgi:hypothetical protein